MFLILYSSQSGNTQFIARQLCKKYDGTKCAVLDDIKIEDLNSFTFIVFVVSTHGRGDAPFNGSNFILKLRKLKKLIEQKEKKETKFCFFNFKFAMLGLGSTSYMYFNQFSKDLNSYLKFFGAKSIFDITLADSNDPEGFYTKYMEFDKKLRDYLHKDKSLDTETLKIKHCDIKPKTYTASIISNTIVSRTKINESYLSIGRLVLNIPKYKDFFVPGDCVGILPENTCNLKNFKIFKERILFIDVENIDYNAFNKRLNKIRYDLYSTPHWKVFEVLHKVCTKSIYKEKLKELANDYDSYIDYVKESSRKNIFDILHDFKFMLTFENKKTIEIYRKNNLIEKFKNIDIVCFDDIKEYISLINYRWYTLALVNGYFVINYNCDNLKGLSVNFLLNLSPEGVKNQINCSSCSIDVRKDKCIGINTDTKLDVCNIDVKIGESKLFTNGKKILLFCTGTGFTLAKSLIFKFMENYKNIENKIDALHIYYGHRNTEDCLFEEYKEGVKIFKQKNINVNLKINCVMSQVDRKYVQKAFKEDKKRTKEYDEIDEWIVIVCGRKRILTSIEKTMNEIYKKEVKIQAETW